MRVVCIVCVGIGMKDGILIAAGGSITVKSMEDKIVARRLTGYNPLNFGNASELEVGNWECVVQDPLPATEYLSGRCFLGSAVMSVPSAVPASPKTNGSSASSSASSSSAPLTAQPTVRKFRSLNVSRL